MDTNFFIPITEVFEKSDSVEGDKSHRIGGYASTEKLDRQKEILLQKGLDFTDFIQFGWFNDDHDKTTSGVIGYPTLARFDEGKGWYVEGYLIKGYERADKIWELAKALHKSKSERKLGFSVQGSNTKREGNKIVKAVINQVAITHCPVNPECTMDVLTKSLCLHIESDACSQFDDCCTKSLVNKCNNGKETCTGTCNGTCHSKEKDKTVLTSNEIMDSIINRGYNKQQVEVIYNKFKEIGVITG